MKSKLHSHSLRLSMDSSEQLSWLTVAFSASIFLFNVGCDTPKDKSKSPDPKLASASGQTDSSKPSKGNPPSSGSPSEPGAENVSAFKYDVTDSAEARAILEACIAKYKRLKSYEDRGVLRLKIPNAKQPIEDSEEHRVAFAAPNKLAIQTSRLQASWNNQNWQAVVAKGDDKPFGNQRLVRPLPDKIDLKWLVVDHLGSALERPATGSPIQLQLLFDTTPLSYLTGPESKVGLLAPAEFDNAMCDRVQVVTKLYDKEASWTFWIDKQNQLLRKYELPLELIELQAPWLAQDMDRSKTELTIELRDAKADVNIDWRAWQIPSSKEYLDVRRFIDAPPRNISPMLGQILKPFDLQNNEGKLLLDSAQRTKPITVLCFIKQDETTEAFTGMTMALKDELERRSLTSAEIVLVADQSSTALTDALKRSKCDLPLAIDKDRLMTDVLKLQKTPSIVVLDKNVRVQHVDELGILEAVPEVVDNLARNVDIASRALQNAIDNEARFNSRLHRSIVEKADADRLPPIEPFPFTFHETKEAWVVPLSERIIAAGSEAFYPQNQKLDLTPSLFGTSASTHRIMTVLDELGQVHAIDNRGNIKRIANIPIDQADNAKRIHVLPDPWAHRWIAIIPEGLPRFWLIDGEQESDSNAAELQNTQQLDLNEEESATTFAWTFRGSKPSLSLTTDKDRLLVVDPERRKTLRASANQAIAIVPVLNDRAEVLAWNVVDSTGTLSEIAGLPTDSNSDPSNDIETKQLPFLPEPGLWTWGRNGEQAVMLGLAHLPAGETGSVLQLRQYQPTHYHALSVRREQCRILSSTTSTQGFFYWLASAPNRVLHLQTVAGIADQMSLGKRLLAGGIYPDGEHLRIVLAVDKDVSCWSISIPQPAPPAQNLEQISPSEKPRG